MLVIEDTAEIQLPQQNLQFASEHATEQDGPFLRWPSVTSSKLPFATARTV